MKKKPFFKGDEPDKFDSLGANERFGVCSACECCGLITVPPESEAELESYEALYDFGPDPEYEKHF